MTKTAGVTILVGLFTTMQPAFAQSIEVGVIDSLTGPSAFGGAADVCGIKIAADVIRDEKILSAGKLQIVVEDDQSKPAVASQAAAKLTAQGIKFFVGGAFSGTILSTLPILKDAGALHTGGTSQADQLFDSGALVVRLNNDNSQAGATTADYVSKTLGAKKIAYVALQGSYGEGALASIKKALPPGTDMSETYFVPTETTNFQSVVTSISASKPDAVVWAMFGNAQVVAFLRQYKQAGLGIPLVGSVGTLTASQAKVAAGAADGVVSADLWSVGIDNAANNLLKASFEKYKDQHSECASKPLDKQVAVSYSQLYLLASAIERAGTADPQQVRNLIIKSTWDLPQGSVTFQPSGQAVAKFYPLVGRGDQIVSLNR